MSSPPEPVQGDTLELIEHHKKDCNRYKNSFCGTVRCMKRGGWRPGVGAGYETATCEAYETVLQLQQLTGRLSAMEQERDEYKSHCGRMLRNRYDEDVQVTRRRAEDAEARLQQATRAAFEAGYLADYDCEGNWIFNGFGTLLAEAKAAFAAYQQQSSPRPEETKK